MTEKPSGANEPRGELTIAEALAVAMALHRHHDHDTAETVYRRILDAAPDHPDALHFLGVLCHERGRHEEAISLIRHSLEHCEAHPDAHNNLANVYRDVGRTSEAEARYRRALELRPADPAALLNLGNLLRETGRYAESADAYQRLLGLAPQNPRIHYYLGRVLERRREHAEEAVECYRRALAQDPSDVAAYDSLSHLLCAVGRGDEAIEFLREWAKRVPEDPVPRHLLAAQTGQNVPSRAADGYVTRLFDEYAQEFDAHLVGYLDYCAPEHLAAALETVLPPPAASLDVLDAGCGTGLCAPLVKPRARRLAGVDLSPRMVERARSRGYDELAVAELTEYLRRNPGRFDLVISADTLVYFGALDGVLAAIFAALRPGGWLAFTVEQPVGSDDDFRLHSSGRYQHSEAYLRRVLREAGFSSLRLSEAKLRTEGSQAVVGWVVLARRQLRR